MYDIRPLAIPLLSLVLVATSGCTGQAIDDTTRLADSESALNYKKPDWKKPFWERPDTANSNDTEKPRTGDNAAGALLSRVGLLPSSGDRLRQLMEDLQYQAPSYGLSALQGNVLDEALNHTRGCSGALDRTCADSLAVYPGVRLLVRITADSATDGLLRVLIHDTTLGLSYRETTVPLGEDTPELLLEQMARRVALADWSTRAFAGEDGQLYVSAGAQDGLTVDTQLTVHKDGTLVRTPAGQPVAWRKGPVVGSVRVTEMVGDDMAVVEHETGAIPTPRHYLLLGEAETPTGTGERP